MKAKHFFISLLLVTVLLSVGCVGENSDNLHKNEPKFHAGDIVYRSNTDYYGATCKIIIDYDPSIDWYSCIWGSFGSPDRSKGQVTGIDFEYNKFCELDYVMRDILEEQSPYALFHIPIPKIPPTKTVTDKSAGNKYQKWDWVTNLTSPNNAYIIYAYYPELELYETMHITKERGNWRTDGVTKQLKRSIIEGDYPILFEHLMISNSLLNNDENNNVYFYFNIT